MKKIYLTLCLIGMIIFLQSSRNEKQINYAEHITAGSNNLIISHEVKDFKTWKVAFDADEARRNAAGMTDLLVTQGVENEQRITVVLGISDMAKCEAFFSDTKTGELMAGAGATSPPEFTYFNAAESSIVSGHSYLIIEHDVVEYNTWKKAFDSHENVRNEYGISVCAVGSTLDNKNHILAILNAKKIQNFNDFLEKSNLKDAMKDAGLASEPKMSMLKEAKK